MKQVRRDLTRDEIEALREKLTSLIPEARATIPEVLRAMRVITRKTQAEYAALCGVAPKVVTNIELGRVAPTMKTLEKLLRPFGFGIGVVSYPQETENSLRR
jgi:transcriptional regulator with XRE-family HTH domain